MQKGFDDMAMSPYIFIVLILIILSMYRERTVKPGKLLIIPLLLLWGVSASFQPAYFHSVLHVAISGILLLIGLACGFGIGKMVNVRIHPETGKVTSRGSLGSVILILVILSLRMAARTWSAWEQRDVYCHYSFYVLRSPRHHHSPQHHALQSIQTTDRWQSIHSITERRTSMNGQTPARHYYKKLVPSLILILNCIQFLSHPTKADPILLAFVFAVYLAFIWIIPMWHPLLLVWAYSSDSGSWPISFGLFPAKSRVPPIFDCIFNDICRL